MCKIKVFANDTVRLQTAPTALGTPKLTHKVLFETAPDPMEYVQDKGFRERHGAVSNRTYRTWRTAKLTLMVLLGNRTYRVGSS